MATFTYLALSLGTITAWGVVIITALSDLRRRRTRRYRFTFISSRRGVPGILHAT